MRINWNYIKAFVLLVLVVFLYAFSLERSAKRNLAEVSVEFLGENNLYITQETVNKLLIQNQAQVTSVPKETLDLNELESALNSNTMIKSAEVYLTVDGTVKADVKQRNPIARVHGDESYYIDDQGLVMPLSENHSAHVPLVTGSIKADELGNVFLMATKINEDAFLKKHIVEVNQSDNGNIVLISRVLGFKIHVGDLKSLDKKINNFKAFYQKARKDNVLDKYSKVSLQFVNQVVCTKK